MACAPTAAMLAPILDRVLARILVSERRDMLARSSSEPTGPLSSWWRVGGAAAAAFTAVALGFTLRSRLGRNQGPVPPTPTD
jgi:hypothetical protein